MTTLLLAETPLFGANERGIILFGFEIYYYALCIVAGIVLAAWLSALLMRRRNLSPDLMFVGFVFVIPVALLCARIHFCITDGMEFKYWLMWDDGAGHGIRNGGLSIIGGLIGGVTTAFLVCFFRKVSFLRAADCVMPTILVAQALGRWGNFFNAEVYGGVVTNPSQMWFPFAVPISPKYGVYGIGSFADPSSTWHYAFFFYESILNLIMFGVLFSLAWKWDKKPNGLILCAYLVWYGLLRSIMEPLRDPDFILSGGGVPWSLVLSIVMIVGGIAGAAALLLLNYHREDALLGSKKGDPCGITQFQSPYKDEVPYFDKINLMGANYPERPPKEPDTRSFSEKFSGRWESVKGRFRKEEPEEKSEESDPSAEAREEDIPSAEERQGEEEKK